jgi:Uma2 family endonuclease
MVDSNRRRARYRDVVAAPERFVAEIIDGELFLSPRPAFPHGVGISSVAAQLQWPFGFGRGGPGGWVFVIEPEIHLGRDVVVPDIAAWRRERMPDLNAKFATVPPAWLCEGLSPSTSRHDRTRKLPLYAKSGVEFAWLYSATELTLEVYGLVHGAYELVQLFGPDDVIRAQPFESVELRLDLVASLPARVSERVLGYGDRPIVHGARAFDLVDRFQASPAR